MKTRGSNEQHPCKNMSDISGKHSIKFNESKIKNPWHYNQDMINAVIGDNDLPEIHLDECRQPYKVGEEDEVATIFEYLLTQYDLRQSWKMYGECGEKAMKTELDQEHRMYALIILYEKCLQRQKRRRLLLHLFFD